MKIKYFGPAPSINVGVFGRQQVKHVKGQIVDYPDKIGEGLLADKKNDFRAVNGEKPKSIKTK